jgi:hypothetical protein
VLSPIEDYFSKAIFLMSSWKYFGSLLPGVKPEEHPHQDDPSLPNLPETHPEKVLTFPYKRVRPHALSPTEDYSSKQSSPHEELKAS